MSTNERREIADRVEIFDPRMTNLVHSSSLLRRLGGGAKWSEGPLELADGSVIWSDIPRNQILRWHSGEVSVWRTPSNFTNGHTMDHDGRVLHCSHGARAILRTEFDGTVTTLVDRFGGHRLNSPNDIVMKSDGSIWFTDPPYGILSNEEGYQAESELPGCFVFRFDPSGGQLDAVVTDMLHPNGLAFSPDESILYISDTSAHIFGEKGHHHLRAYDIFDGVATNGRVFAEVSPGLPDGFRLDVHGNLFVSCLDAIQVFAPDATLIGRIPVPEKVANCCWGGPDQRTLYVAASTSLYAIDLQTSGSNVNR